MQALPVAATCLWMIMPEGVFCMRKGSRLRNFYIHAAKFASQLFEIFPIYETCTILNIYVIGIL